MYEGEELGRGVNGVRVEILIGKHGSRPKSMMNRLQCQVKEFYFRNCFEVLYLEMSEEMNDSMN